MGYFDHPTAPFAISLLFLLTGLASICNINYVLSEERPLEKRSMNGILIDQLSGYESVNCNYGDCIKLNQLFSEGILLLRL
jgi:hypothetical protein